MELESEHGIIEILPDASVPEGAVRYRNAPRTHEKAPRGDDTPSDGTLPHTDPSETVLVPETVSPGALGRRDITDRNRHGGETAWRNPNRVLPR